MQDQITIPHRSPEMQALFLRIDDLESCLKQGLEVHASRFVQHFGRGDGNTGHRCGERPDICNDCKWATDARNLLVH